jgi:hypothetical protein
MFQNFGVRWPSTTAGLSGHHHPIVAPARPCRRPVKRKRPPTWRPLDADVYLYGPIAHRLCLLPPKEHGPGPMYPPPPTADRGQLSRSIVAVPWAPPRASQDRRRGLRRSVARPPGAFNSSCLSHVCVRRAVTYVNGRGRVHCTRWQLHDAKTCFSQLRFRARAHSSHAQGV